MDVPYRNGKREWQALAAWMRAWVPVADVLIVRRARLSAMHREYARRQRARRRRR